MVEQLGFAIILSLEVRTCPLTSGTTNFVGSILQVDELSITTVPISANLVPIQEVPPPAEKIAISGFNLIASSTLIIS